MNQLINQPNQPVQTNQSINQKINQLECQLSYTSMNQSNNQPEIPTIQPAQTTQLINQPTNKNTHAINESTNQINSPSLPALSCSVCCGVTTVFCLQLSGSETLYITAMLVGKSGVVLLCYNYVLFQQYFIFEEIDMIDGVKGSGDTPFIM